MENRRNDRKNVKNDRRNHKRNSKTNRDNEKHKNIVSELWEELNEAFVKGVDISKEKIDVDETIRSKLVIKFDSIKLN